MFQYNKMDHTLLTYKQTMNPLKEDLLKNRFINAIGPLLFFISVNMLYAQTDIINSPTLISSSGGTLIQDNYNLCFSLGEMAIESYVHTDAILTQGFHQEQYQLSAMGEISNQNAISIFPNPTTDKLHINCQQDNFVDLIIKDIKGSVVFSLLEAEGMQTHSIQLSHFSQGVYFLEIDLTKNKKQVYKIQKIN